MSKSKRILTVFFAVLLTVTATVTGCQKNKTGSDSSSKSSTSSTAEKKPAVTITWYSGGDDQQNPKPVMDKINSILLDKYNIQLDFKTIPFGSYDEKMNMIISSGTNYDLCFTSQSWVNKYPVQVAKGAFLALDDYLPKYPKLKSALPDFLFEQARVNGKIYAIPNYQITYSQFLNSFRTAATLAISFFTLSVTKVKPVTGVTSASRLSLSVASQIPSS